MGPGRISQKMLLVIDVELTRAGWEASVFERLLSEAGVAFDANIKVEPALEKTLLDSRFFEQADDAAAKRTEEENAPLAIVYVVARGGAIDRVWRQMKQDPSHYGRVSLDMALQPSDTTVFRELQQLGGMATLQSQQPDQQRQGVAHRLEMSPDWNGMPSSGGGMAGLLAGVPGAPLNPPTPDGMQPPPGSPSIVWRAFRR